MSRNRTRGGGGRRWGRSENKGGAGVVKEGCSEEEELVGLEACRGLIHVWAQSLGHLECSGERGVDLASAMSPTFVP